MTTNTDNSNTTETGTSGGVRGALGSAKNRAGEAYSSTRERTSSALSSTRETASNAKQRAAQRVDTSPVVALAGGIAVGAILAAVLPVTRREQEALGQVGHKVNDVARDAANSAVEAGRQQVNEITTNAMAKVGGAVVQAVVSGESTNAQ